MPMSETLPSDLLAKFEAAYRSAVDNPPDPKWATEERVSEVHTHYLRFTQMADGWLSGACDPETYIRHWRFLQLLKRRDWGADASKASYSIDAAMEYTLAALERSMKREDDFTNYIRERGVWPINYDPAVDLVEYTMSHTCP